MPGMVDTHWHMWTTLLRSFDGEKAAQGYFPRTAAYGQAMTPDDMYQSTRLAAAEALYSGITTVHDYCHNARSREHADAHEHRRQTGAAQAGCGCRPFDPTGLYVEDPGETDDDGKADRQRDHHEGQHCVGPVQPVHDRLDDLEHRERGDAVPDHGAEDATALQLRPQRHGVPRGAHAGEP